MAGIVRLYLLKLTARERAIADRAKGGGPSPYRHALAAVRAHIYDGKSLAEIQDQLERLHDESLAKVSLALARQILGHIADIKGDFVRRSEGSFLSANGAIQVSAISDVSIETPYEIINLVFWNNKTAELYDHPAQIAGYFYIHATPANFLKRHVFRFVNLRTNKTYDVSVVRDDVKLESENFLLSLENLILAAENRRAHRALKELLNKQSPPDGAPLQP